jgi:predicted Zn-dependent peptidase
MKIIEKKLSNGLRVVMIPQADAQTATALILVGTGSKYEKKTENGLSHFLEHMYFKGTTNRPNAKTIAEAFDTLGALSNAFTTHEYTGYYAKGNPAHTNEFIDILSDIYCNSLFPESEIKKEIGVVLEEINMYEDMPSYKASEQLFELMYGDQPAGWSVIGPKATVSSFTRKDLIRYQKSHYTADNTIVVIAGSIDPVTVYKKIKVAFAGITTATAHRRKKVIDTQSAPQSILLYKKTDQANLALGFRSIPIVHADRAAVSLLAMILGGGMSSRLFLLLREELGAVYDVHIEHDVFTDHGVFAIAAGIDKTRLDEIVSRIIGELVLIKNELVSEKELAKVKEQAIGMMRLGLESSDSIAGFYGTQVLLKGMYSTPEQLTKEYMKVTAEDIQRVAKKIFVSEHANLSVVGPFEKKAVKSSLLAGL